MPSKSTVKTLPSDIKAMADRLIGEDRETQTAILNLINAELDKRDAGRISRSAFSRYAHRMGTAGERIRQTREIAQVWAREIGDMPDGDVGRLLNELVTTMAFDAAASFTGDADVAAPTVVAALARAARDLEHASSLSAERELRIRRETAKKAAAKAEAVVLKAGRDGALKIPKDLLATIREQVYGIVETP